jgi:hypothetical protein
MDHTKWLINMKLFCVELGLYLDTATHVTFPKTPPNNSHGLFNHLCEMSTQSAYVSNIDIMQHNIIIFEIQSLARKLLTQVGTHPAMTFSGEYRSSPFFEQTLLTAVTLAVEHQQDKFSNKYVNTNLPLEEIACS